MFDPDEAAISEGEGAEDRVRVRVRVRAGSYSHLRDPGARISSPLAVRHGLGLGLGLVLGHYSAAHTVLTSSHILPTKVRAKDCIVFPTCANPYATP